MVDCMMLWFNNLFFFEYYEYFEIGFVMLFVVWMVEIDVFFIVLLLLFGEVIFVSNEIGLGVVLMGVVMCFYVDEFGWLN